MSKIKALGLCGSLRSDSFNLKLLNYFLGLLDARGGFETHRYGSLELPLVNQDLESKPLHPSVTALQTAISEANVIVIASPEYNASLSGALKNAIDWGTRPQGMNCWQGKIVVLLSASPGALGGARGLIHLRTVLSGLKTWIIPEQVQCPSAHEAFDAAGALRPEGVRKQAEGAVQSLENLAKKLLG